MKVHLYEKAVLSVSAALLVVCLGALLYASLVHGIHLPGRAETVDPQRVYETPPFDQPGVREIAPGRYEVVLVGQAWSFNPPEIRVPAGAELTFVATSTDVLHGFNIERTRLNMMLIPGQVSRMVYTFSEPGEYLTICHEFCGLGHQFMHGKIIVE
jgi:cytochrome c oxidase subunit II